MYSIFTALATELHKKTISYDLEKDKLLQWGRTRREHTNHSS